MDVNASGTTGSVSSADGTTIGYRRLGSGGPPVVLVHGGMETAGSHLQLAEELAGEFTVYLPDRRGRGASGPHGAGYRLRKEVEDLDALLAATGAEAVFGLSSGAIICLQAALELPAVRKVAIYEPPLSINGLLATDWLPRFDREIEAGDHAEALVIATKETRQFGHVLPGPLLKLVSRLLLGDMLRLVRTFHHDMELVIETKDQWRRYADVRADVLLMGGGRSPAYLKTALDELERVLPEARRVEFAKLNHGGSGNRNRGGNPPLVAGELRGFFASPPRAV
ncbi:alpha/beta hydrolase [Nonomuraea sp. NN258]|uniref:alpha/beta fold hydrolase n=1 Tax=Nonomuraea antri TaxID=2730852 RepID=UPI0015685E5F|nr:alpha/beta hydrolase [Nonomuraea antri]NRQ30254.1 alpha/beta hydrolase [Nonomuraea antri]